MKQTGGIMIAKQRSEASRRTTWFTFFSTQTWSVPSKFLWTCPFHVLVKWSDLNYRIANRLERVFTVHVNRLKGAYYLQIWERKARSALGKRGLGDIQTNRKTKKYVPQVQ